MNLRMLRWQLALAGVLMGASGAVAALGSLGAELSASKVVVSAAGVERFTPLAALVPGDVVEYRATYTNHGAATLPDARGTLPVPDWAEYLGGSAAPPRVTVSVDGRVFAAPPPGKTPAGATARAKAAEVAPREYRFLRWSLGDLAPGASATVVFRVRVWRDPGLK